MGHGELSDVYEVREPDGSWWVVGWDPELSSFFAQHLARSDLDYEERVLEDLGRLAEEITTMRALSELIGRDLPGPVTTTGYEVIVTKEENDDPNGFSRPVYDVHVPAALDSLSVPAEFFEPDTVYELEVLALEESGNQTITVGFFVTE